MLVGWTKKRDGVQGNAQSLEVRTSSLSLPVQLVPFSVSLTVNSPLKRPPGGFIKASSLNYCPVHV